MTWIHTNLFRTNGHIFYVSWYSLVSLHNYFSPCNTGTLYVENCWLISWLVTQTHPVSCSTAKHHGSSSRYWVLSRQSNILSYNISGMYAKTRLIVDLLFWYSCLHQAIPQLKHKIDRNSGLFLHLSENFFKKSWLG